MNKILYEVNKRKEEEYEGLVKMNTPIEWIVWDPVYRDLNNLETCLVEMWRARDAGMDVIAKFYAKVAAHAIKVLREEGILP